MPKARRIEKVRPGEACYVEWLDASYPVGGWVFSHEVDTEITPIQSVGFLIAQDESTISLAQSATPEGTLMHVINIPRVAIQRIQNCSL